MAFKMKGFSGFKQTIEQPKDHQKKFFTQKHREIEPDREGGLDPISVISTETVGKEKKSGKSKTFIKTTDKNTGKVTYTKNINKVGKHPTEGNVKEISEKKYLRKKKRYKKKKGFEDRTSKQSKIKTDKNIFNTFNPRLSE